jgi:HAD superfamily hydrolase (TIGR01459 family)
MHIDALSEVSSRYAAILCDIWGVVHNGVRPFAHSVEALKEARRSGLAVVLITNAPRPNAAIEGQLAGLGVDPESWDRIVTSGDVTRSLIETGPRKIFHLGPERDLEIFDGLDVELVEEFEANGVVCTGLYDDETETPEDYADLLQRLRSRNLPFTCANPDIVAERGHKLVWCAGALARDYGQLGGRTLIAGKPFRPIYELAMQQVAEVRGVETAISQALAIGDGMLTDVKGAADYGLDYIYISGGIHAREYGDGDAPDRQRLAQYLADHGRQPVAIMHRLR